MTLHTTFDALPAWPPIPQLFPGSTVVCVASGPSLVKEDLELVRDACWPMIVTNSTWKAAPYADVLYACDKEWWDHAENRPTAAEFDGLRVTQHEDVAMNRRPGEPRIFRAPRKRGQHVLSFDPSYIGDGENSGFQALNLAVHFGARRIVLLGYDMGLAADGRAHHHPDHTKSRNPEAESFLKWIPHFNASADALIAHNIEVVNCSRASALTCFLRVDLRRVVEKDDY